MYMYIYIYIYIYISLGEYLRAIEALSKRYGFTNVLVASNSQQAIDELFAADTSLAAPSRGIRYSVLPNVDRSIFGAEWTGKSGSGGEGGGKRGQRAWPHMLMTRLGLLDRQRLYACMYVCVYVFILWRGRERERDAIGLA